MRLVFAGTPAFSVPPLQALLEAGHDIAGVYTQPDRPAGRGRKLQPSAVAAFAEQHGLLVLKPESLRKQPEAVNTLRRLAPDCMVVVAYGLILPQEVLDIPRLGCLNIHASLLPRWRGAAPIQRAILAGDTETGVAIMQMEAGLDTGPVRLVETLPISPERTAGELQEQLTGLGAKLIVEALRQLDTGTLPLRPQPEAGVTYAAKLNTAEARLDWTLRAGQLQRRIHGYNPIPGAWCEFQGERIKVLRCRMVTDTASTGATPGRILAYSETGWTIACGEGTALCITELQRPGGKPATPFRAFGGKSQMPGASLH